MLAQAPPVPVDPCHAPGRHLVCPNLVMPPAYDLHEVRRGGRRLLLMANELVNVGPGPLEFRARRTSEYVMAARQVFVRTGGRSRATLDRGARLTYKYVDRRRGAYWKFADAARFELWSRDATGERVALVRTGPKLDYCLRDLFRVRLGARRFAHYPACDQGEATRAVTLGISVGWADGYPWRYPQNWIDVSGLRGCFDILQRADPLHRIVETDERDNVSLRTVRIPYRPGPQRCG